MRFVIVVAVLCVCTAPLGAQSIAGRITGTVRAASDSAPLANVHVTIRDENLAAQTDDSGAFVLDAVLPGRHVLSVRRLGFRAFDVSLSVNADTSIVVWLTPVPRRLAEIEVHGKRVLIPAHMRVVYERANRNHGTLITAADIERAFPLDTKSMLQGIAGLHVETRKLHFVRCAIPPNAPSFLFATSPPKVHVYVNGSRHSVSGDPYEALQIVQRVHPNDIELMEVYGGVTRIPVEFLVDACAVIAIWTKAY